MAGSGAAGGSLTLVRLINDHRDELEADLAHYYRLDLRDVFRHPEPRPPHPMRAALREPAPRWLLGGIAGMLAALVLLAPVAAALAACVLATLGLIAWTALTPDAPARTYALTPRRVIALVRHLPHESATVAALRGGPQFRGWTADRYLLTLHGDLLQRLIWIQAAKANPKRKPPQPKPLPRPEDGAPAERPERNAFRDTALRHLRNARNAKEVGTGGNRR